MSLITVNGHGVIRGEMSVPRIGAWHADFDVDSSEDISGAVTLKIGDSFAMMGTVERSEPYQDIVRIRIGAGGNGLRKIATAKDYTSPLLKLPLQEMLTSVGESLSSTADASVVSIQLQQWTTWALPAGVEVAALLQAAPANTAWRILPDGTLWVGPETWAQSSVTDFRVLDEHPRDASMELGLLEPIVQPGTTLDGRKVDYVETTIEPGRVRAKVWWVT